MTTAPLKIILCVLLISGVGIFLVQLEHYSAGRRVAEFLRQTRRITARMTEDAVVKKLGNPTERLLVQADTREYTACRGAGATRILSYRLENHGWFRGFGLKAAGTSFWCVSTRMVT